MNLVQACVDRLSRLIAFPSVSSTSNADVSRWTAEELEKLGFNVERTRYQDKADVEKVNLVACRNPKGRSDTAPGLAYFCHTDVVPADRWTGPGGNPFHANQTGEKVYGRGSCDMKGSLATMLTAASTILPEQQTAPLWIVCTADEEVGFDGAKYLVEHSSVYQDIVAAQPIAIIGEPTHLVVVHAHKGIGGLTITSRGRAAHSSTTLGVNANEAIVPILQTMMELCDRTRNDEQYHHDAFDPPVLSWNFGVSDGADAVNITPERSKAWVCFRPMPGIDGKDLVHVLVKQCEQLGLEYCDYPGSGPMWTDANEECIQELCRLAVENENGPPLQPKTVCYGTDGGVFTQLKNRVVCGPGGIEQAHTTDEWIAVEQLDKGIRLYQKAIENWCTQQ